MHLLSSLAALLLAVSPKILVPAPANVTEGKGTCVLGETITYRVSGEAASLETYMNSLGESFCRASGKTADLTVSVGDKNFRKLLDSFTAAPKEDCFRDAAYALTVTEKGIDIKALAPAGAFYALQSLCQMVAAGRELETCTVVDWPRLQYRGLMLDISRNFRDKKFIEKQMDAMALVKMNKLHLHLTDDAGWRIQIDSRPELAGKAAWRIGSTWKQWRELGGNYAEEGSPLASGGYLTKDDVKELVAYAAERHIDIIPEFEIPAHSGEVLAVYPELACVGHDGKRVMNSDMCPGSDALFGFIDDVIGEIVEMFPSEYIHVGGDEASRQAWKTCPNCRKIIESEGISDMAELQSWVMKRVEKIVEKYGRKMIGWDEILEGGIPEHAAVMAWRGTAQGRAAAEAGHDVVMSPNAFYYLDYTQDAPVYQPEAIGGYIPLELAYSYDADIDSPHLLGVQGNVWTEFIPTASHLEYMIYPRAFAVAETGWSLTANKNYPDFKKRVSALCAFMRKNGYSTFDIDNEFGGRPEAESPAVSIAIGKPVEILTKYADNYKAAGDVSVNDGVRGGWSYSDGRWLGFLSDIDIIIDLEEKQPVHYVGASFMAQRNNHVGVPERIEVYVSDDGKEYRKAGVTFSELPADTSEMCYETLSCVMDESARFIRFKAFRRDMPLHAWLFTDEIIVN